MATTFIPVISFPNLQLLHLPDQWFVQPLFTLVAPNLAKVHIVRTPESLRWGTFSSAINLPNFNHLTVPLDKGISRLSLIIQYSRSISTLCLRAHSSLPESNLINTLGRPDPDTGEWSCPSLQHIIIDFVNYSSAFDFEALPRIITARAANSAVMPLHSIVMRRPAQFQHPKYGPSLWRAPFGDAAVREKPRGPSAAMREWLARNLAEFECLSYPFTQPPWCVICSSVSLDH